jgi:hypothetical protein
MSDYQRRRFWIKRGLSLRSLMHNRGDLRTWARWWSCLLPIPDQYAMAPFDVNNGSKIYPRINSARLHDGFS